MTRDPNNPIPLINKFNMSIWFNFIKEIEKYKKIEKFIT